MFPIFLAVALEDAFVFLIFAVVALLLIFMVAALEDAFVLQVLSFAVVAPVDVLHLRCRSNLLPATFVLRCR
jgi:hypothetical protein